MFSLREQIAVQRVLVTFRILFKIVMRLRAVINKYNRFIVPVKPASVKHYQASILSGQNDVSCEVGA